MVQTCVPIGTGSSQVLAVPAVHQLAFTASAIGSGEVSPVPVGEQRVDVRVGFQVDASTGSTIAAIRPASGDVLLAASADCTIPAITAFNVDKYLVNHFPIVHNNSNKSVDYA